MSKNVLKNKDKNLNRKDDFHIEEETKRSKIVRLLAGDRVIINAV